MDRRQLAIQQAAAFATIKQATEIIAEKMGIDPPDFENIPHLGGAEVVALRQWQVIAEYQMTLAQAMNTQRRRKPQLEPQSETETQEIPGTEETMDGTPGLGIQVNSEEGMEPAKYAEVPA